MKKFILSILVAIAGLAAMPVSAHHYQPSGYAIAESQNPRRYMDNTGRPYYTCPRAQCYNAALSYNPYYQYYNQHTPRVPPKMWYGPPVYGHTHGPHCGHAGQVYYNDRNWSIGINYADENFGIGIRYNDWGN